MICGILHANMPEVVLSQVLETGSQVITLSNMVGGWGGGLGANQ